MISLKFLLTTLMVLLTWLLLALKLLKLLAMKKLSNVSILCASECMKET